MSEKQTIAANKAVALHYKLTIDDGIVVDASDREAPLWYLHGNGNLIPGLENELNGLEVGAKKTVVVKPEDGYGVRDPERVQQVPKEQFPPGTSFELGDHVEAQTPDGHSIRARVTAVAPKKVTVDFNHELAGKTLNFDVEVIDVRAASKDEIAHGHVHGPGGHHH